MVAIMSTTVTCEALRCGFRHTHDVRLRERYHCILLLMDGKSFPEPAQWLYRDEETVGSRVHAFNEAGLRGLGRAPIPEQPA
jgi:hypothetical protein